MYSFSGDSHFTYWSLKQQFQSSMAASATSSYQPKSSLFHGCLGNLSLHFFSCLFVTPSMMANSKHQSMLPRYTSRGLCKICTHMSPKQQIMTSLQSLDLSFRYVTLFCIPMLIDLMQSLFDPANRLQIRRELLQPLLNR